MKKATAFLVASMGILALVGAGCSDTGSNNTPSTTPEENQTSTPPTTSTVEENTNTSSTAVEGFTVTVEPNENGNVKVSWTVPNNFNKKLSFRVLHSAKPNPDSPAAFWFQYMNSTRSTELSNVPKGNRYFRVCGYDLTQNKCVNYSNEVEAEVK